MPRSRTDRISHRTARSGVGSRSLLGAMTAIAAVTLAACGGSGDDVVVTPQLSFAERCTQLVGKTVAGGKITATKLLAASATQPETCSANGDIVSSPTSTIKFLMDFPADADWNKKLMQTGGGGYNGSIMSVDGQAAFSTVPIRKRGYVFIASDSGHQDPNGGFDFALNNPTGLDNFLFNAHPQLLKAGVAAVQELYGQAPVKKYFMGMSTGGREALQQAQRFPESYDAIIAGMPVVDYSIVNQQGILIAQTAFANGGAGWIRPAKVKLFATAQMEACDALDGAKDGLISNSAACHFDVNTLRCADGKDTGDSCLSDAQIATAKVIRSRNALANPVANSITTAAPLGIGGETEMTGWTTMQMGGSASVPGSVEFGFADGYLRYGVTGNVNTNLLTYARNSDAARWKELSDKGNATNPDLNAFAARGGKLILWHGEADHLVPPGYSTDYYASVAAKLGQSKVDSFVRFYMVPGLGHTNAGFQLDVLTALENWDEKGTAPETLTKSLLASDGKTVVHTRPVCRYPAWAKYNGTGDMNQASNFSCVKS